MSVIKRETQCREPTPSPPPRQMAPPMSEVSLSPPPPEVPVPSFIQVTDGGLFAESSVPASTIFGPYKGTIGKVHPRRSEDGDDTTQLTGLKFQDSAGQEYAIDRTDGDQPWWAYIRQATEHNQANVGLFSHNGVLYLKSLKHIPKAKELFLVLSTPLEDVNTVEADDGDLTTSALSKIPSPLIMPSPQPANKGLLEGPPFKCDFCCIEFRNPSNLDAHRVYYCPGTATKPMPSSRRRSTSTTQTVSPNNSTVKTASVQTTETREVPAMHSKAVTVKTVKTFVCQLCQSSFESQSNCESHMLLLHCDEVANLCKFCNFISEDRKGLCQHVFSHVKLTQVEESCCSLPGNSSDPDSGYKIIEKVVVDGGDEKENRYEVTATATKRCRNKLQNSSMQSVLSPGMRHISSSPVNLENNYATNLASPEMMATPSREERCSPAKVIRAESPNGISICVGGARSNRLPSKEEILSCPQCDFVTSRESVLLKHMTHHTSLRKKTPDRGMDAHAPKTDEHHLECSTCHQCNIVFMSKKNYLAHKQYYCASRHAESTSPSIVPNWDSKPGNTPPQVSIKTRTAVSDKMDTSNTRRSLNGSDELGETYPFEVVPPGCSPFDDNELDTNTSPRSVVSLHSTSQLSATPSASLASPNPRCSPKSRQMLGQPLQMIHLDGKRQFLSTGAILQGPQLVLVTPIVIPQSPKNDAAKLDGKLKIPVIRSSRAEQPLDLSTKPKSPPLSDPSNSNGCRPTVITTELSSQHIRAQLLERQSHRCEECKISFSKKESLVVHKQYYCASRHMYSQKGLVRTKQYNVLKPPTVMSSPLHNKSFSPDNLASQSPNLNARPCHFETRNSKPKVSISGQLNSSQAFSSSGTAGSDAATPQTTHHAVSCASSSEHTISSTFALPNGNATHEQSCSTGMRSPNQLWCKTPKLKRAVPEDRNKLDKERSLPPIKRKKNLILDEESRHPLATTIDIGGLTTNGIVIKEEPTGMDSVTTSDTCTYSSVKTVVSSGTRQMLSENMRSRSTPSPHTNSQAVSQTMITIKKEPQDSVPASKRYSGESPRTVSTISRSIGSLQSHLTSAPNRPNLPPRPSEVRHPTTTVTPLTIPMYRHSSPRQSNPSRHMTLSSYLNTANSRPLLRGVKPTVKHCRNCNISFSSLSTFIAHKKYYCASHHQAKNTAT
ncbi:zinc finger protein ZFPM1-like isoform X2 [Acanthaster planci]|nr:zinc finger protein ZFPM1-like isoform X2 [Acanthaster planci]